MPTVIFAEKPIKRMGLLLPPAAEPREIFTQNA